MAQCVRDTWIRKVASEDGPASPTTRLVLLVLGSRMDRVGYCFPSTDRLTVESGLSKRSVLTHLSAAEDDGWISREVCGTGRGWKRHEYHAALPDRLQSEGWGGEAPAPRQQLQGGERAAPRQPRRGEPHAPDAVNLLHPNLKENHSNKHMSGLKAVDAIFDRCRILRDGRLGKVSGPALQLTRARRSAINARLSEGFTRADLEDAAAGFYADSWQGRDRHLDPKYAFRDDETVRKWIAAHRNGTGTRPANLQEVAW